MSVRRSTQNLIFEYKVNISMKKGHFQIIQFQIFSLPQQNLQFFYLLLFRTKMDSEISILAASNMKPVTKEQGYSLHQLSKWNQHLDMERLKSMYLQQDLMKQQKVAKQNELLLNKQVHSIERQAVLLASALEQQKTKHQHLLLLVKNGQQLIYQHKLDKRQDLSNKKQPDEYEQSKKILFDKEKQLQTILDKINSSEFEISKKIHLIRSLRRQRGIHSNVFDKLQNQHFDVQFFYKQLLIERILLEKQLQIQVSQFNNICQKSTLEISRINQGNKQAGQIQITENEQTHRKLDSKVPTTFRIPQISFRDKDFHFNQIFKSRHDVLNDSKIMDQMNLDQSKKLNFKKKLNSVLNEIGCQSLREVLQKIHQKAYEDNRDFDQYNKICDQIFTTENEIKNLKNKLHQRKNFQSYHLSSNKHNLYSQISDFIAKSEFIKTQINNFTTEFQKILKNLVCNSDNHQDLPFDNFKSNKKSQNINKLTFSENHQLLMQIMGFFNDEIFDIYLNYNRTNNKSKSKVFGQKTFTRKKNHKLSTIGFEKKVRIIKTQTENTNLSTNSMRNSEYLDTILSMQNSTNEKFERGERTDNLSIMTQNELIEESKRLIRQIKKKKSEFVSSFPIKKK